MTSSLLISVLLLLLSPFSLSSAVPAEPILKAAEILSDSGYTSMALTLELASHTLLPHSPSLTIFAPADTAFNRLGQPPLSLIQYHILPLAFSFQSLKSLPLGAKISTVLPRHSLIVTASSSDDCVSLNNVTVRGQPVYDDGSLIIFGIDKFFNPYFRFSKRFWRQSHNLECLATMPHSESSVASLGAYSFREASAAMRTNGCSIMASFLDIQFLGSQEKAPMLTVFAPANEVIEGHYGSFSEYVSSFFHRHVVPCRLSWGDLVNLEDGTLLRTYSEGFTINVTRSLGMLLLNDVPVIYPDMYFSNWLVVHGVVDVFEPPMVTVQETGPPAEVANPKVQEAEPPAEDPKPIYQSIESSAEVPMHAEQMKDYDLDENSAEVPVQTEPMTDYAPEVPEQIENENSSSRNGDGFEAHAVEHYHFSVFH
nr:putative fasciclin-like arabinogalactan protein 20 [Quercus suber]